MTTQEELATARLRRNIVAMAERLRKLADEVERETGAFDRVGSQGRPDYASVAVNVQHTVLWGVANLSLDKLTESAWWADEVRDAARRRGEVAEEIAQALNAYAGNYPEDVFPPISDSRDAIGGTAMRHAYTNAAEIAREHGKEH